MFYFSDIFLILKYWLLIMNFAITFNVSENVLNMLCKFGISKITHIKHEDIFFVIGVHWKRYFFIYKILV